MTTDRKVEIARQIADQLIGITPSEWGKWCSYAQRNGLKKALMFARTLKNSPSLRPGPRQSYKTITDVMRAFQEQLEPLSPQDLAEVLGYVRRWLFARRETSHEEGDRG